MPLKMLPARVIIKKLGLQSNGEVQKFLTAEGARRMERFVPYREGTLSETVIINGQPTRNVKSDRIIYSQPYASYVFHGLSKSGKPLHYTKSKHQLAGPYWNSRMMSVDREKIIKAVQNFMRSKKND